MRPEGKRRAGVASIHVSPSQRDAPTIVLVRHGATEWSASGQHTSHTDIPLTDAGRRDAERIGERLAGFDFALVLASPMSRARDTAALAGFGDRASVDDDLLELDYGEYDGRTTAEIRQERPGWDVWRDDSPGGETPAHAGERADRVIERAVAAGGDVALFAHGHFLRILGARWMGVEAAHGGNLGLSTGAVCELGFERERRAIWNWNDTRHLG
jgi:broad specificity phosphatase PhoE